MRDSTKKSRKSKGNLCSKQIIQEVQYLYSIGLQKSKIAKRLGMSITKLNKILSIEDIDQLVDQNQCINLYSFQKLHSRAREYIQNFIENSTEVVSAPQIQSVLKKNIGLRVSVSLIQNYLKKNLNMSYRKVKSISFRHNQINQKLCRQYAAQNFIQYLSQHKRIINIDESIIQQTDQRNMGWFFKEQKNFQSHSQRLSQVSIIAGVSNFNDSFFTINRGKNNSLTFMHFLIKLIKHLDNNFYLWRQNTILLIDNAAYHRSKKLMYFFHQLQIPIMFLGPYQYRMAPIETFFAFIKQRDLNPLKQKAETKSQYIPLMKEIAVLINRLDKSWLEKSFINSLKSALESLYLKDL